MTVRHARSARRRAGFTLMELLLVLAILVILGSLAVVSLQQISAGADIDAARAQIGLLETPLGVYQLHMKSFPATAQGLDALRAPPSDSRAAKWKGPYMDEPVPPDPWDQPYQYQYPGKRNPQKYDLWSLGPDGQDGTEDDIGNWPTGV